MERKRNTLQDRVTSKGQKTGWVVQEGARREGTADRAGRSVQEVRAYVAFPVGARSAGGWRLELRRSLGRSLRLDTRLKGDCL